MTSDKIQLYSYGSPNGWKVSVMLEEVGAEYDAHYVDIRNQENLSDEFQAINPKGKIPVIIDPTGDAGGKLCLTESGAILFYLAEKFGKFLPKDAGARARTMQWLMWQMGELGPKFGQCAHFLIFATDERDLSYSVERSIKDAKFTLETLNNHLGKEEFVAGSEITVADFAIVPWTLALSNFPKIGDVLNPNDYSNIQRWQKVFAAREGVQKGMQVCKTKDGTSKE